MDRAPWETGRIKSMPCRNQSTLSNSGTRATRFTVYPEDLIITSPKILRVFWTESLHGCQKKWFLPNFFPADNHLFS